MKIRLIRLIKKVRNVKRTVDSSKIFRGYSRMNDGELSRIKCNRVSKVSLSGSTTLYARIEHNLSSV